MTLPAKKLNKKLVLSQQGWDIFVVDPFAIRNRALPDEEFTNFATKEDFKDLIPGREIWIARANFEVEGMFFIVNALAQMKQRSQGIDKKKAYAAGVQLERDLREKVNGVEFRDGRPHKTVPKPVYSEEYLTLSDREFPVDVWRIDGNLVRSYYKTDYTEGGHGVVYDWVPKDEIWIEKDLADREVPFILCHEYLEMRLMRDRGLGYDRAHSICSKMEFELRRGTGLTSKIAPNASHVTKENLRRLTEQDVFEELLGRFVKGHSKRR